jgi:hypothetical protein
MNSLLNYFFYILLGLYDCGPMSDFYLSTLKRYYFERIPALPIPVLFEFYGLC